MALWQRHPWQITSPVRLVWCAATAFASAALKSKSPPTHCPFEQLKRNRDFALARLTVYLISLSLVKLPGVKYASSTVKDLKSLNATARVAESSIRWFSC